MNLRTSILLFIPLLSGCSAGVKTDIKSVSKTVTTTEYLVLNEDFARLDTIHKQRTIEKYDSNNNVLEEMDFLGKDLTCIGGYIYKYNDDGKKVEEYSVNKENEVVCKEIFSYSNNACEKIRIFADGKRTRSGSSYYDAKGNQVKQIHYYQDSTIMMETYYKYNSAKQEIEQGGTLDGKPKSIRFRKYDSNANISEQRTVDKNGNESIEKFAYEGFDNKGNWTVRKSTIDNIPHSVTMQSIEYK
ncbi:hypothetical protein [Chitinophaga ginsengisoli]|uniref:YD repeat-containing protein n=1 Tax=Chitinophaga ginsengisoli TaxID=363837 RepID=A0A2P8GE33_9BACT|nr:hypothetical protein [Chitinophaga ginsengisoli]PSL32248.1 hypothetical protein CLV42_104551 [Chitinophaga ginsengisoli]